MSLIKLMLLGSGNFGNVYNGTVTFGNFKVQVAIKASKDYDFNAEFYRESIIASQLKHPNIIEFIGICIENHFLLFELMEGPQLLMYLRSNTDLTLLDMLDMGHQVAQGCAYLEKMQFVHGDLAARNCLLSSADPKYRLVKIGDFGLSKDLYGKMYYSTQTDTSMAIRWMAPEALTESIVSTKTDVWSFAVLMWEIFSSGTFLTGFFCTQNSFL